MQEIVRRCDMPVKRKGGVEPCGERIPGDAPLPFGLDGVQYEGDFCGKHRDEMRSAMDPYISVSREMATRVSKNAVRASLKGQKGTFTTKDVRKWLMEQGREVSPSGRIPNELIEEYKTSHVAS